VLSNSFKWKHYEGEIILLNVRWYLKYPLSYRNLKEMMIERGIKVDHTTIMRWVYQYSPEIEKPWRVRCEIWTRIRYGKKEFRNIKSEWRDE
jgi:transposase-like protein